MYVATPEAKNPTLEETFPSDPVYSSYPPPEGYRLHIRHYCTYAMSLLPNRIDQLSSRTSFLPTNSS